MACSGLHCAGCAAGAAVPVGPIVAYLGLAWVAEHLAEVIAVSAACGILSVVAVVALSRITARREAEFGTQLAARRERETLTATVLPQVSQGAVPVIENHVHYHYHGADSEERAARVIRQALAGAAPAPEEIQP